jgi:hypothetical protein
MLGCWVRLGLRNTPAHLYAQMRKAWLSAVSWDSMSLLSYKISTFLHGNFYFRIFSYEESSNIFLAIPFTEYKKPGINLEFLVFVTAHINIMYVSERCKFHDSIVGNSFKIYSNSQNILSTNVLIIPFMTFLLGI